MPLFENFRQRFTHRLESHQIEEDYTPRVSRTYSRTSSVVNETICFEPETVAAFGSNADEIPSYEASQLMHNHNQTPLTNNTNSSTPQDMSRRVSSNHLASLQTENVASMSSSTNISRQSSEANDPAEASLSVAAKSKNKNLKSLGLKFLNARQHFALACCRDISLIPCVLGLIQSWRRAFFDTEIRNSNSITSAKLPEHFLTGVWCIVAGYLSFSVLDGLMIRWIVTYLTSAAILRMLSMSTIILTIEQYLVLSLSAEGYKYGLHIWILISCCLTFVYVVQNFVTLNLDLKGKRRARFFDLYNIAVFAVVPVGVASFLTMIGLLRSLLIVRLDVQNLGI